ncbi:MAG: sigma-E processing peptidase SpoIIGA [Desulfitobacterium sp.]
MERYLDIDLVVNGSMDALLIILVAHLLNFPLRGKRLAAGVMAGEIPVIFSAYAPASFVFELSKFLVPMLMIGLAFPYRGIRPYLKTLLLFWIVSAGLGGLVYAVWGWVSFDGILGSSLRIGMKNLWILPLGVGLWWVSQNAWYSIVGSAAQTRATLYDLRIDLGAEMGDESSITVRALLDTGNQLRDPLTGNPVILVEEEIAAAVMPEELLPALQGAWRDLEDPWPWLWQSDSLWIKYFVFIPYQGVGHKSWLLGIRPQKVVCTSLSEPKEMKATLAIVQHELSSDRTYQALLHPEHVRGGSEG